MSERRRAVIFDRDGTLNVDHGYTWRPEALELMPGAAEAVAAAKAAGRLVIVATNQSGIGRGYFTEADMHAFNAHLIAALSAAGGSVDAVYFCPFHEDALDGPYRVADHPDRKPNPGMLTRAIADWDLDAAGSLTIGDRETDMEAGRRAGVPGLLYRGGRLDDLVRAGLGQAGD